MVCFGPLYNNVAIILNSQAQVSEASRENSRDVIREAGEEGMVLLENDGVLPLTSDTDRINVFGWASIAPIFGGTGSGSSDTSGCIGIIQSLQDAGYETNETLTDMYTKYRETRILPEMGNVGYTDWTLPEPTADYYTDEIMQEAEEFSDTAVVVLGRSGGEGQDLPTDMNAVINGTYDIRDEVADGNEQYNYFNCNYDNNGDYNDFDEGEHYLELSNTEEAMLDIVCSAFDDVIVVINSNNPMELSWVENYDSIGALILAPGTGETGMAALGEILKGDVNPSGKTVDTYVYDLTAAPNYNNTGNFAYSNVEDLKEAFTEADDAYQGNIAFVNYVEGIYLGYKFYETAAEEGLIQFDDVVQYPFGYGLSYTSFSQEISNFTDNGDSISIDVNVTNTGDVTGKSAVEIYFTPPYNNGGIEKASVNLIALDKTENLDPGASETVSFTINKEDMASYDSRGIKTENGGYVLEAGDYTVSVRSDSHTVLDEASFHIDADIDYSIEGRSGDEQTAVNQFQDYSAGNVTYLSRANGFANYEEAAAAPSEEDYVMDDETRAAAMEKSVAYYDPTLYDDPDDEMPVTGADNGRRLSELTGKDYDDPLWDELLDQLTVEEMSDLVNLGGFQTVAVDSVRKTATLDSDGTSGLNDQETNRCSFLLTYSDEQAIREIYLKPFEMCVKNFTGDALAVMSSFNWIGTKYSGSNPYLLNNVLRGEWGYRGMVLSDWDGSYGYQLTDDCVRNGNDAMLGFNSYESNVLTDTDSATLVQALRQASKNIMYTVANSGNYTVENPDEAGLDNMTLTFIGIDVAIAAVLAAVELIVVLRWRRKLGKAADGSGKK